MSTARDEKLVDRVCDGAFSGSAQAGEPNDTTALAQFFNALLAGYRGLVPDDFGIRCHIIL
jgi:hypothetical protein